MADLMRVVPNNIFRSQHAPNYLLTFTITAVFGGLGLVSVALLCSGYGWHRITYEGTGSKGLM